ncbi:MAG: hypothetical protein U5L04_01095 [Trueperaceae bacterium]|nr:hypothetical protein [Trueperaceae bacterium]
MSGDMKLTLPPEVHHNQAGFTALVHLASETEDCFLDDIDIDMKSVAWFDADMCAAFGAVLLSDWQRPERRAII